ncbi:cytochrome oxidase assembly protein ShyY1 [Agromyces flavus]|uniref:SURF1-like protein n=1 Tax=Agromyces flavus TaxID=589382 RepID=A0A1H1RBB3_9MICO|nr:SURF1 family protein [Agromyces flavus]MCP2367583.1 cytochrome oxidase assembly protein ShyY1 [Agromyces flavus]GGI46987.1 SURF1-like protein [Agromyces flavus]SDS32955.1 Cytochrome oxidase assembly protein ShyY1 [Agromyces flavus]
MSDWRFLAAPRWAGYLALVIVFAIACSALGTWQFNRRAEALAEVARIDANYDAEPVPVAEALPDPAAFDIDQRWQVVALTGEYLHAEEVVVRNRPFEGSTGFEVITPLRLTDGTVFMVDRGWIAQDSDGRPSEVPSAPEGEVSVTARLKAGEARIAGRTSSGSEMATIDLDELAERVGEPSYTGAYGILVQSGDDAAEPPLALPRPVRDEGPHLSYALQWFVFALLAFIALGWFANQERKALSTDAAERAGAPRHPAEQRTPARPARPARARSDADVEDEILDRR